MYALKKLKVSKIYITKRTAKSAINLSKMFNVQNVSSYKVKTLFSSIYMLINCSACGMDLQDVFPFVVDKFNRKLVVYDLIYSKLTPFVKFAKTNNVKMFRGEGMLVRQGACSFKMWTGIYPNIKVAQKLFSKVKFNGYLFFINCNSSFVSITYKAKNKFYKYCYC